MDEEMRCDMCAYLLRESCGTTRDGKYDIYVCPRCEHDNYVKRPTLDEKIRKIADHYGIDNQISIFAEEATELMTELFHYQRGRGNMNRIREELADVMLVWKQIVYLTSTTDSTAAIIERVMNEKADRQLERMEAAT